MARSPIETAMRSALKTSIAAAVEENGVDTRIVVVEQAKIGRAVVDFLLAIGPEGEETVLLAVECDGHDFHERTKEQASRDRSRDRALQALGVAVFRFTGSDIFWDVAECADECIRYLVDRDSHLDIDRQDHWCAGYDAGVLRGAKESTNSENPRKVGDQWVAGDIPLVRRPRAGIEEV